MKESSHWYDPETGDPRHTITGANGKERGTTLRDARKYGWLPSVTTIFKTLAAPELDRWKQQQVLLASMTLPRNPGEPDEDYMARVMEDAFVQVDKAADLGTRVHAALEDHFQGRPYDPELTLYVEPVDKWVKDNGVQFLGHELRIINGAVGYAGTTDGHITVMGRKGTGILDFKTRKSKPDYPMTPWQKEPMQIAAYARMRQAIFGVNVFISTTEPGRVEATWYEPEKLNAEFEAFLHVVKVWQHFTGYVPPSVII